MTATDRNRCIADFHFKYQQPRSCRPVTDCRAFPRFTGSGCGAARRAPSLRLVSRPCRADIPDANPEWPAPPAIPG